MKQVTLYRAINQRLARLRIQIWRLWAAVGWSRRCPHTPIVRSNDGSFLYDAISPDQDADSISRSRPINRTEWRQFWRECGQPWRTEPEISSGRQRYLTERRSISPEVTNGIYPFGQVKLDRADVEWLLSTHRGGKWLREIQGQNNGLAIVRSGLDLRGADLRGADLHRMPLSQLRGGLEGEDWFDPGVTNYHREQAAIRLEGANLRRAQLDGSSLRSAHLEGADLTYAHLEGATLRAAFLNGKLVDGELLEPTDLRHAYMDNITTLEEARLGDPLHGFPKLADVRWSSFDASGIDWSEVNMLGDEREARQSRQRDGTPKTEEKRVSEYGAGVRANRQLSHLLRTNSLHESADKFAYRAQVLRRDLWKLQRRRLNYIYWLGMDLIAGYGYKPRRIFASYVIVIAGFAILAYSVSIGIYRFDLAVAEEHLLISLQAFHGSIPEQASGMMAVILVLEAITGLLLQVTLIATITQRFVTKW